MEIVYITTVRNLFSATQCPLRNWKLVRLKPTYSSTHQNLLSATLFYQVHSLYLLCSLCFGICSLAVDRGSLKMRNKRQFLLEFNWAPSYAINYGLLRLRIIDIILNTEENVLHDLHSEEKKTMSFSIQRFQISVGALFSLRVPRHHPFVLIRLVLRWRWVWSNGGLILSEESRGTERETCFSANLYVTCLTWSDRGWNPGIRDERPATNSLSHGTDIEE
jgi:hypothetical protein